MTIVTSLDYQPTLHDQQVFTVMTLLEEAIASAEPVETSDLAERILGEAAELALYEVEAHAASDLARLRAFVVALVRPALEKAGGINPSEFAAVDAADWASDIAVSIGDEVSRSPEWWRDDLGHDRAESARYARIRVDTTKPEGPSAVR